MIALEFENQKVKIDAGELVSYTVDGHEFIHQKGSPGWGSADTEMFPIIGPVNEAGFQVQVPRSTAIQDQHGLLRQFPYELEESEATSAVFSKTYRAGTPIKNSKFPEKSTKQWLVWPYNFRFTKQFILSKEGLEVRFVIDGEQDMPFMLGYHPAFKLHTSNPVVVANGKEITLAEILAVGSRALEVANCEKVVLKDAHELTITTSGFGNFMCWTEVNNMVCLEPISFYPYAVEQQNLHEGFQYLSEKTTFTVMLAPTFS